MMTTTRITVCLVLVASLTLHHTNAASSCSSGDEVSYSCPNCGGISVSDCSKCDGYLFTDYSRGVCYDRTLFSNEGEGSFLWVDMWVDAWHKFSYMIWRVIFSVRPLFFIFGERRNFCFLKGDLSELLITTCGCYLWILCVFIGIWLTVVWNFVVVLLEHHMTTAHIINYDRMKQHKTQLISLFLNF